MKKLLIGLLILLMPALAYADKTLTGGDGVTLSTANGDVTVTCDTATSGAGGGTFGCAKFDSSNFADSSGNITIKSSGVDLTDEVTGTLPVANGGVGTTTLTDGGVLLGSGASAITAMSVLADGSIIVGDGTTDPVALSVFTNSTGDVKHEAGGLEGDVSAYTGVLAISGGAVSEVDAKSELETQIADLSDFAEADGDTWTGTHDMSGAAIEIENSADPDLTLEGEISYDSDDDWLRGHDGTNQVVLGQKIRTINATIIEPDLLDEASTLPIWQNRSGATFNITAIYSFSDDDDTDFTLVEITDATDFTATTTIEAITISTDGTGVYYDNLTSGIDHTTIESGNLIVFDNDGTDTPDYISFAILGWFDGDVN